ncbi:MAG: LPS-assembly protein LptD [Opitutia bacterium UBA7350]|nr:MAG: LPS-assembly protein LptD [Opitutae bacterium UBA7350]
MRFLLLLFCLPAALVASLPELSSIDPIEYDETAQRLVARGDARLNFESTQVSADEIIYYQEYGLADAQGDAAIMREGYRMVGDRVSFDANDGIFTVQGPRTGTWPLYAKGLEAGGTVRDMTIENAQIYYTDPGALTPNIKARRVRFQASEANTIMRIKGATFRIGQFPFFYLPRFTYYLSEAPFYFDIDLGKKGNLGQYLQTTSLIPINPSFRIGSNIDYYAKRGVLIGPASQYVYDVGSHSMVGALSSGYIEDKGNTGVDLLNNPIDPDRSYLDWRHRHHIGERVSFQANLSYRSDSAVMRDFRENVYNDDQMPDTYAEAVYLGDNFLLSAFVRFNPSDYLRVTERLPEFRFDYLPSPMGNLGIYQQGAISYALLRDDLNKIPAGTDGMTAQSYGRFDLNYQLLQPLRLNESFTLTPLAAARFSNYHDQVVKTTPATTPTKNANLSRYAIGFDLTAQAQATYATRNAIWGIRGLRHTLRPSLKYRYFSKPDGSSDAIQIERLNHELNRPTLDLTELRSLDQFTETHLIRLGLENRFQTRAQSYGSRTLAALNFYQDILLDREEQKHDDTVPDTLHATWVEMLVHPAPWLKFDLAARISTQQMSLDELRTRTTLLSGDAWRISLSTDLMLDNIDQYRIYYIHRLSENHHFIANTRYNADMGVFDYTSIGLVSDLGSAWELLYDVTMRDNPVRESDFEFSVGLRLVEP